MDNALRRSPRQLWNALLRIQERQTKTCPCRSPRQLWNALLPGKIKKNEQDYVAVPVNYGMLSYWSEYQANQKTAVAVPVNYGMLSYLLSELESLGLEGRSPRQLWNALLHDCDGGRDQVQMSQSPSIMECSPTKT